MERVARSLRAKHRMSISGHEAERDRSDQKSPILRRSRQRTDPSNTLPKRLCHFLHKRTRLQHATRWPHPLLATRIFAKELSDPNIRSQKILSSAHNEKGITRNTGIETNKIISSIWSL